ncbi:hypothetical protein PG984_011982 [Apiospora sp. TS-2023a]
MSAATLPTKSGNFPVLSDLAIRLVQVLQDPDKSYLHAWEVIKEMAQDMHSQTAIGVDGILSDDVPVADSMFQLLHTIHPFVLRSVCMGTVAYDFHDEFSEHWKTAHNDHGPGAYAVSIAIQNRDGKFLTPVEITQLIRLLNRYAAGCSAWKALDDHYGTSQLNMQQASDLNFVNNVDKQYKPDPSVEAQATRECNVASDTEDSQSQSQKVLEPRFGKGENMSRNIQSVISMFQRRLIDGANPNEPQMQSPLVIGNSNDLQNRKQVYRPEAKRLHSAPSIYGLVISCIKAMGLRPREVFVPFTKAWTVKQINQGEILGTVIGSSMVGVAGLNVYPPGYKGSYWLPTAAILEETQLAVHRREWPLENTRRTLETQDRHKFKALQQAASLTYEELSEHFSGSEANNTAEGLGNA